MASERLEIFSEKLFSANKSFFSLTIVWTTIGIFIFAASSLGLIIYADLKPNFDFSYSGVEFFFKIFNYPIRVLVSAIPLLMFYAATHKSEQSKLQIAQAQKQIETTNNQNAFINYYKHRDEFKKHCDDIGTDTISIYQPMDTHHSIFPNCKRSVYTRSNESAEVLSYCIHQTIILIGSFDKKMQAEAIDILRKIELLMATMCSYFNISIDRELSYQNYPISERIDIERLLRTCKLQIGIAWRTINFDTETPPPPITFIIKNMDLQTTHRDDLDELFGEKSPYSVQLTYNDKSLDDLNEIAVSEPEILSRMSRIRHFNESPLV